MDLKEAMELINKEATVTYHKMQFKVLIREIKSAYGNTLALISPIDGSGESWINVNSLVIKKEEVN